MSKHNRLGFTLVELLAVIVILAIILSIAIPGITSIIERVQLSAFTSNAQLMRNAAKNLAGIDSNYLPGNSGAIKILKLEDIQSAGYINTIKNPKNNTILCDGYVVIKNVDNSSITYTPYLKCGTDYKTTDYIEQNLTSVEVLVVAGGGSGGSHSSSTSTAGGGGGAGGLTFDGNYIVNPGTILTNVGVGGMGTTAGGNIGGDSMFGTISVNGGGRGTGSGQIANVNGGSGGGGSYYGTSAGTGIAGQGNNGGSSIQHPTPYPAAGGGGAGSTGVTSTATVAGNGGEGLYFGDRFSDSYGANGWFAGGGGGGIGSGGIIDNRGIGKAGGGNGGYSSSSGVSALTNTGSGGGGSSRSGSSGGSGAIGVILVRYLGPQKASGGTVTQLNGYTIHAFTQTGSSTFEVLSF